MGHDTSCPYKIPHKPGEASLREGSDSVVRAFLVWLTKIWPYLKMLLRLMLET